ncbi:MAG: NAD(P)-dependent oxidoreductase [Burkholderiaceae bacterium]
MAKALVFVSHPAGPEVRRTYINLLSPLAEVVFAADLGPDERHTAFAAASVLVTFSPERELDETEINRVGHLGMVQCLAAGRDRFPFQHFAGVRVAFNPGAAAAPIAEHTLALILAAAKNLFPRHRQLVAGEFNQAGVNTRLDGGTAAVIGLGAIGSKVARLLQAFGMKVRAVNRSGNTPQPLEMCRTLAHLDEVLDQSDVAVISVELNAATKDLIGIRQLQLLRPNAILVNVSRAAVVQEDALFQHLKANPEFRAGLDVWWVEPMHAGKIELGHPFFELPNVIGSPHNSPMVEGIFVDLARAASSNIARFLDGQEPRHLADRPM